MPRNQVKFEITAADKTAAAFKRVLGGLNSLTRGARSVVNSVAKIGVGFAALGTGAAVAGLVAINKIMSEAVELANIQEAAENKLGAVLKTTGEAAGFNLEELKKMASAMQEVTTVGDETTLAGMAILATFKNIKGEAFQQATMAALDMSHVMDQDLKSSMVQLGKALNDPVAGLSALSRVGVTFTEQQKEMIKALVESGNVMGAQQVMLDELKSEFGGAAAEAATTFSGKIQQMKNNWGDLLEELGFVITKNEYFSELATKIKSKIGEWIEKLNAWREANKELVAQKFDEWIKKIRDWTVKAYEAIVEIVGKAAEWYEANEMLIKDSVILGFKMLVTVAKGIATAFNAVGKAIGWTVAQIVTLIEKISQLKAVKATVEFFGKASPVRPLTETIDNVMGKFGGMAKQINNAKIGTTVGFGSDISSAIFSRFMEMNQKTAYAQGGVSSYGSANIGWSNRMSARKQQDIEMKGIRDFMQMMGGFRGGAAGGAGQGVTINVENAIGDISDIAADKIAAALQRRGYALGG